MAGSLLFFRFRQAACHCRWQAACHCRWQAGGFAAQERPPKHIDSFTPLRRRVRPMSVRLAAMMQAPHCCQLPPQLLHAGLRASASAQQEQCAELLWRKGKRQGKQRASRAPWPLSALLQAEQERLERQRRALLRSVLTAALRQAASVPLLQKRGRGQAAGAQRSGEQAKRADSSASGWSCGLLFSIGKRRERTGMIRSEAEQQANARRF